MLRPVNKFCVGKVVWGRGIWRERTRNGPREGKGQPWKKWLYKCIHCNTDDSFIMSGLVLRFWLMFRKPKHVTYVCVRVLRCTHILRTSAICHRHTFPLFFFVPFKYRTTYVSYFFLCFVYVVVIWVLFHRPMVSGRLFFPHTKCEYWAQIMQDPFCAQVSLSILINYQKTKKKILLLLIVTGVSTTSFCTSSSVSLFFFCRFGEILVEHLFIWKFGIDFLSFSLELNRSQRMHQFPSIQHSYVHVQHCAQALRRSHSHSAGIQIQVDSIHTSQE